MDLATHSINTYTAEIQNYPILSYENSLEAPSIYSDPGFVFEANFINSPQVEHYPEISIDNIHDTPSIFSNPIFFPNGVDTAEFGFYPLQTRERDALFPSIYSDPAILTHNAIQEESDIRSYPDYFPATDNVGSEIFSDPTLLWQ